jgi:hypothetical protein
MTAQLPLAPFEKGLVSALHPIRQFALAINLYHLFESGLVVGLATPSIQDARHELGACAACLRH